MTVSHLKYATLPALHKIPVKKFPLKQIKGTSRIKTDSFTLEICNITGIT